MRLVISILFATMIFSGLGGSRDVAASEPYSSDATRKWAEQREAADARERQRQQENARKKKEQQQMMQTLEQTFNIEDGVGGTDTNDAPVRRRSQSPATPNAEVEYESSGQDKWGNFGWPECSGPMGTVYGSIGPGSDARCNRLVEEN